MSSLSALIFTPNALSSSAVITATGKSACSSTISGYMQDFNSSTLCSGVTSGSLTDKRDNQIYTVAKINGNWWMTRNLAIGCNGSGSSYGSSISSKSLSSELSNVTNSSSNPWNTPTINLSSGNSDTNPRMACSSTYGAWYNYAAASAGTIAGSSNTTEASYSICPKNWRLPTESEQSGILDQATIFTPAIGGAYNNGQLDYTTNGYLWSATPYDSGLRYYIGCATTSCYAGRGFRTSGHYVRCIRST